MLEFVLIVLYAFLVIWNVIEAADKNRSMGLRVLSGVAGAMWLVAAIINGFLLFR